MQHEELKYVHSLSVENIIKEYLEDVNKWVNSILSTEGKLVIHSIKKEQNLQSDRITEQIILSTQEIIKK